MLHRDGLRPGVRGKQRVEGVRGPGHDELVALREQRQGGGLEQLGGAVSKHDLLRRHPVALGKEAAHPGGMPVRIAVHEPACPRDGGVHDLRLRQVGPLGTGEVKVRQPLEREPPLTLPPRAPFQVQLPLVNVVELAVVVAETHLVAPHH